MASPTLLIAAHGKRNVMLTTDPRSYPVGGMGVTFCLIRRGQLADVIGAVAGPVNRQPILRSRQAQRVGEAEA